MVNSGSQVETIGFGLDQFSIRTSAAEKFICRFISDHAKSVSGPGKSPANMISSHDIDIVTHSVDFFYSGDHSRQFASVLLEISTAASTSLFSSLRKIFPNYTQDSYRKICASTLLWRCAVTTALYVQSGQSFQMRSSEETIDSHIIGDYFGLASRLIWADDWSSGKPPITLADLHQISIDVARFQNNALLDFLFRVQAEHVDTEQLQQIISRVNPPAWLKEKVLRFVKTPVLVQGFGVDHDL
jgi:hypothetical protein